MNTKLALVFMFAVISGEECGGLCECDSDVVSCHYLTKFPDCINEDFITDLTLTFSDILGVPSFKTSFPRLETLTFRQCRYVTCQLLERLHRERPNLRIVHSETCTTFAPPSSVSALNILITSYFNIRMLCLCSFKTTTVTERPDEEAEVNEDTDSSEQTGALTTQLGVIVTSNTTAVTHDEFTESSFTSPSSSSGYSLQSFATTIGLSMLSFIFSQINRSQKRNYALVNFKIGNTNDDMTSDGTNDDEFDEVPSTTGDLLFSGEGTRKFYYIQSFEVHQCVVIEVYQANSLFHISIL